MDRLSEDEWRKRHAFGPDMKKAHKALFHPFASDAKRQATLDAWFQDQQPCLFGRIAAAINAIHYVFLDDQDLASSDQHIQDAIHQGVLRWRQRSLAPRKGISAPAHGLVVAIVSPRVAFAEPNDVLKQLSLEILRLWGCNTTDERQGKVHWEDLYIEHPTTHTFVKFTFSVDFFAAAGDGRWWHDHRVPGGLAFTANSAGHMRRYKEWYQKRPDQQEWLVATAMETIARAKDTKYGKATWLRPLGEDGEPFVPGIQCPVQHPNPSIAGFDWTRYAGHLHTDHSVRPEFFRSAPEKPDAATLTEWVQDFQYLYDPKTTDHVRFVEGVTVSREEVERVVGRVDEYVEIASPKRPKAKRATEAGMSGGEGEAEVDALVKECQAEWSMSADELARLNWDEQT